MEYKEFVERTINQFDEERFVSVRQSLIGEYIRFNCLKEDEITKPVLAEKICDYFEKLEYKTSKQFDKQLQAYTSGLNSIVEDRIAKTPKQKKGETPVEDPRARKYYDKATSILKSRDLTVRDIIDYTRIMLCLYTAIIDNKYKPIENFDFSAEVLRQEKIVNSMKDEKTKGIVKKRRFNTEELYSLDTCVLIFTIIMLHTIANERG